MLLSGESSPPDSPKIRSPFKTHQRRQEISDHLDTEPQPMLLQAVTPITAFPASQNPASVDDVKQMLVSVQLTLQNNFTLMHQQVKETVRDHGHKISHIL